MSPPQQRRSGARAATETEPAPRRARQTRTHGVVRAVGVGGGCLPDDADIVGAEGCVLRHDGQTLALRLGNDQPVEGVAVMQG